MKKKLVIGLLIALVMLLAGCAQPYTPPVIPVVPAVSVIPATPVAPIIPPAPPVAPVIPEPTNGGEPASILPGDRLPPENITWISPGKVNVSNFYPGARAEYPLTIHNGNDTTASFSVYYRYPNHVGEGYEMPPEEAQDWVIVADPTPILMPRETRDVMIALDMPEGANISTPKWEFWVGVKDTTQAGMVRTELCCRWLITMRGS